MIIIIYESCLHEFWWWLIKKKQVFWANYRLWINIHWSFLPFKQKIELNLEGGWLVPRMVNWNVKLHESKLSQRSTLHCEWTFSTHYYSRVTTKNVNKKNKCEQHHKDISQLKISAISIRIQISLTVFLLF